MKYKHVILSLVLLMNSACISQDWTQVLNGRNVWSLARDASMNIYAGGLTGSNSRIWRSTDAGTTWDTIFFGAGQTMWDFAFDTQGTIFVANFSNGLLTSTNNGVNFTVTPISQFNNKNLQGVECGNSGYVYVTTSSGFFRSTDNGQSFTETALTGFNCLPILVDKDSMNIVYVGVSSAGGSGIGVYRSTDNGMTFSSNLNPGKNGYGLSQALNGDLYMITTTSPYNFDRSTNKGLTWITMSNISSAQRGVAAGYGQNVYTAGNGGVFKSTNSGASFINHNLTVTTTPILYVEYDATSRIFAGASGTIAGGVYIITEVLTGIAYGTTSIAPEHFLSQNYPNPFNPSTKLTYSLGTNSEFSIDIYDLSGRFIRNLTNGYSSAGNHEIQFDAGNLSAGAYVYRLSAGKQNLSRVMILLK